MLYEKKLVAPLVKKHCTNKSTVLRRLTEYIINAVHRLP